MRHQRKMDPNDCSKCFYFSEYFRFMKGLEKKYQEKLAYWDNQYEERLLAGSSIEALERCLKQRQVIMNLLMINNLIQVDLMNHRDRAHRNHN